MFRQRIPWLIFLDVGAVSPGDHSSSATLATMAHPLANPYFVPCTNLSSSPFQMLVIGEVIWAM